MAPQVTYEPRAAAPAPSPRPGPSWAGAPSTSSPSPSSARRSASRSGGGASSTTGRSRPSRSATPRSWGSSSARGSSPASSGGLVVRRPGAALFCEVVAALVSMLPGTEWGATVLVSGILQGLGAELAFAVFGYKAFGAAVAALAGIALGAAGVGLRGRVVPGIVGRRSGALGARRRRWLVRRVGAARQARVPRGDGAVSGAVLAGLLGWLLVRALARAGALSAFPAGQEHRELRAV